MKLSMKHVLFLSGILVLGLLNCQAKRPHEKVKETEKIDAAIAETEPLDELDVVEKRLTELEEKLAQRAIELRETEEKLELLETRLASLEIKLAEHNRRFSREIDYLKQMNYIAWIITLILLIILVVSWIWFRSKRRWPQKSAEYGTSEIETDGESASKNESPGEAPIIDKD